MKQYSSGKFIQPFIRPLFITLAVWFAALVLWAPAFSANEPPPPPLLSQDLLLGQKAATATAQARQTRRAERTGTAQTSSGPGALGPLGPVAQPTNTPARNCTYTVGYWKNHPEAWPVSKITLGGISYSQSQALDILNTAPNGDSTLIVAQQLNAAKLNLAQG